MVYNLPIERSQQEHWVLRNIIEETFNLGLGDVLPHSATQFVHQMRKAL